MQSRERRSEEDPGVKRGRSVLVLLAVLALAAALVATAWLVAGRRAPEAAIAEPEAQHAAHEVAPLAGTGSAPARSAEAADRSRPRSAPPDFNGRGRIRGELALDGVAAPARWTLVLEPHPYLSGSERAERRRMEVEGSLAFDARELPLGGYAVRAEVPGRNSTTEAVLLVRGSSDVHVTLALRAAGILDGLVHDDGGRPADGLEVVLERAGTTERWTATVDYGGAFLFRDVVDGDYKLYFGAPERPLVPPGDLRFRAPSLRWPTVALPPTARLRVAVRDERGNAVHDAEVRGSGTPQGVVRARTAPDGSTLCAWLWPARYHLSAEAPDGRKGRATVVAQVGPTVEVEIVVR